MANMSLSSSSMLLTVISLFLTLSVALPTNPPETDLEPRQYLDLPGIDFSQAQTECNIVELAHIRRSFLELQDFAYATNPLSPAHGDDPAFLQFFGSGYNGDSGGKYFYRIFDNLARAGAYPRQGTGGSTSRSDQIQIHCRDIGNRCSGNVLAYTGNFFALGGYIMTFCPFFFDKSFPHASDRAIPGKATTSLPDLITQEHIVLHEMMHVHDLVFSSANPPIIDRKTTEIVCPSTDTSCYAVQRQAYGAYYCSLLGDESSDSFTHPATTNADSYAWFATRKYFERAWQISVDQVGSGSGGYTDVDVDVA